MYPDSRLADELVDDVFYRISTALDAVDDAADVNATAILRVTDQTRSTIILAERKLLDMFIRIQITTYGRDWPWSMGPPSELGEVVT